MASKLTYDEEWYQPAKLRAEMKAGNMAAIRKEYTRLRDISQKRLKRIGSSMFKDTQMYKRNVHHYPLLKDIQSEAELAARLSDLSRFIMSQTSTVSGMKAQMNKSLKTLHEHDYKFVTKENFISFGKFMEEYRFQKLDELYDSGDAAETYEALEKHRVDPEKVKEDFEFWLANQETLEAMATGSGKKEIQESTLRRRMIDFAAKVDKEVFGMTREEQKRYNKKKKQNGR